MFKYFYKSFLISILCGSILMLDFSFKGQNLGFQINQARAESVSTGGVEDSNLMSTLTMVAISVIASRLVAYGKVTTDIMLAAAGGIAFIAGDMMATSELKKVKDKIETEINRTKSGDMTDEQRMHIIRLITMYRASKDAAETKKTLQLAAAAAFAAAGIAAYMAGTAELSLFTTCTATLGAATGAVTAAGAAESIPTEGASVAAAGACNGLNASLLSAIQAYNGVRVAPAPSCSAMPTVIGSRTTATGLNTSIGPGCTMHAALVASPVTACQTLFATHLFNESGCMPPMALYATTAAAVLMMGITSSTIITAVVGLSAPLAELVDTAIYIPARRAVVWGVLAGLAYAASSSTDNVITQLEGDIRKLEELVNSINMQANGELAQKATKPKDQIITNAPIKELKVTADGQNAVDLSNNGTGLPCLTKPDATNPSDCKSFSAVMNTLGPNNDFPDAVTANMGNINKMADGLNNTRNVSGGTLSAASGLAGNANALLAALKKTKSQFQTGLKAAGINTNLDAEEGKLKDSFSNAFKDMMKKNNFDQKSLLAAYSVGSPVAELNKKADEDLKKLSEKNSKLVIPKIAIPTIPVFKMPKMGSDTTLKSEEADKLANTKATDRNEGTANDQYEMKNSDVVTDKTENIFNVISNRYQKSGYPRLFKKLNE